MPPLRPAMEQYLAGNPVERLGGRMSWEDLSGSCSYIKLFKWEISRFHITGILNYLFVLKPCQPKHKLKRNFGL